MIASDVELTTSGSPTSWHVRRGIRRQCRTGVCAGDRPLSIQLLFENLGESRDR